VSVLRRPHGPAPWWRRRATDQHRRAQRHRDERDAEAGAGVDHQVASVGEGLGDDERGQQRRRQQRDDAEQPGQRRPPMTKGRAPSARSYGTDDRDQDQACVTASAAGRRRDVEHTTDAATTGAGRHEARAPAATTPAERRDHAGRPCPGRRGARKSAGKAASSPSVSGSPSSDPATLPSVVPATGAVERQAGASNRAS
jgi:hypothetical protein